MYKAEHEADHYENGGPSGGRPSLWGQRCASRHSDDLSTRRAPVEASVLLALRRRTDPDIAMNLPQQA
jgi:hypothetical protein